MSQTDTNVAVIVRCHAPSKKLSELLETLSASRNYDLYVSANHTRGSIDVGPYATIPYTLEDMRALGFSAPEELFLVYCSDVLFEHYRRSFPDYKFYILIEYDVGLTPTAARFMEQLVEKLRSPAFGDVDMSGTWVSPRRPGWAHYDNAAKVFEDVYAVFFPLVVLSNRAVDYLHKLRMRLEKPDTPTRERIFCEPFVASALRVAETFRVVDLLELFPGCYDRRSCYWGLPLLLEALPDYAPEIQLLHPVYDGRDFLEAHFWYASQSKTLPQHLAYLQTGNLPIAPEALTAAIERASVASSNEHHPTTTAGKVLSHAAPDIVVLAQRLDERTTPAGSQASMADVGGQPLILRLLSRFTAAGCHSFTVLADSENERLRDALVSYCSDKGDLLLAQPRSATHLVSAPHADTWRAHLSRCENVDPFGVQVGLALKAVGARRCVLVRADVVADLDLDDLLSFHERGGKLATIVMTQPPALPLALDGSIASNLDQIPRYGQLWIRAGIMVVEPGVAPHLDSAGSEDELVAALLAIGQVEIYEHTREWCSVKTTRDAKALQQLVTSGFFYADQREQSK